MATLKVQDLPKEEQEKLMAEAQAVGIRGIVAGWGVETLKNKIAEEKAKLNDNNVRFEMWLHLYESKNGPIDRHTNLDPILEEVIALGYKTSSGKDFNKESLRQMIYRTRQRKLQK